MAKLIEAVAKNAIKFFIWNSALSNYYRYGPCARMYAATAAANSATVSPRASAARMSGDDTGSAAVSRRNTHTRSAPGYGAAVNRNRPLAASFVNTRFFHTTVERPARSTVEARNR